MHVAQLVCSYFVAQTSSPNFYNVWIHFGLPIEDIKEGPENLNKHFFLDLISIEFILKH